MSPPSKPVPANKQGQPALRRFRIAIAALVFAIALVAFIDYRDFASVSLKHIFTSTQFIPSALTLATGFVLSSLACVLILALTLAIGRVYCSFLCPLGILQDIISRISAKIRRVPAYKLPYKKPRNLVRHGILVATIIAIALGFAGIALAWLDPYSNFGRIASSLFRPVAIFINNIAADIANALDHPAAVPKVPLYWASLGALIPPLAIFVAITVMAAFRGRLWCNTICPVGTALGLVSRRSLWRLSLDKAACRKCGDCLRACKAQCIDLRAGEIDFSRCVACYDCVSVCDDRGIQYRWHGLRAKRPAPPSPLNKIPSSVARPPASPANSNRRAFVTAATTGTLALIGTTALLSARKLTQNQERARDGKGHGGEGRGQNHDFSKLDNPAVVAPPGASSTSRILSQCTACQLCISACPSHVIEPAFLEYGSFAGVMKPRLNFDRAFCNFNCTTCTDVCPDGALTHLAQPAKHTTRIGLAHTAHPRCIIERDGTACGACAEHCPTAALQIKKVPGHRDPLPVVDTRYCIGCGACQYACPAIPKAIVISGIAAHEKAEVIVQEQVKPASTDDFAF